MSSSSPDNNIIEIRNIEKTYQVSGNPVPVLKGLSLSVEPGEFLAITGPSGNGKSTLLNMITGIDRPTTGEVTVNGFPINRMSENQLARWRGENLRSACGRASHTESKKR